mmetsp:Transcript_1221/g.2670  ORF Transcript_1221/g.2670 Transcript_1221/m.2670 type:complete len:494 (-) Transcript_1221:509-1990(-)
MIMATATTESEDLPAASTGAVEPTIDGTGEGDEEHPTGETAVVSNDNKISNNGQQNDNPEEEEDDDDQDIQCYICWDDDNTTYENNPIRRDCGCKGTAGWVHVNCLVEAIKSRNSLLDNWNRPWSRCQQCMQFYEEPTRTTLKERILQDRPPVWTRLWNYIIGAFNVIFVFGCFLLTVCLCQKLFARLLAYGVVQIDFVMLPMLTQIWDETPLHVQIIVGCVAGATLLKILHEHQFSIGPYIYQLTFHAVITMAIHVAKHADKYSDMEQYIYFTAPFIMMGIKIYRNREQMQREFRQDWIDFRRQIIDNGPGAGPGEGGGGITDMLDLDFVATICETILLVAAWFIFIFILTRCIYAFATNFLFAFFEELSLLIVDDRNSNNLSTSIVDRVIDDAVINNMSEPNEVMSQLFFVKDSATDSIVWDTQVLEQFRDFFKTEWEVPAITQDMKLYHLIHDTLATFDRGGGEGGKLRTAMADITNLRPFRDDYWYCCA